VSGVGREKRASRAEDDMGVCIVISKPRFYRHLDIDGSTRLRPCMQFLDADCRSARDSNHATCQLPVLYGYTEG